MKTLEIVVVGILCHASIEERPCQVVDSVLLVLDGSRHNLGVEVIMKTMIKMRLNVMQQSATGNSSCNQQQSS